MNQDINTFLIFIVYGYLAFLLIINILAFVIQWLITCKIHIRKTHLRVGDYILAWREKVHFKRLNLYVGIRKFSEANGYRYKKWWIFTLLY